MKQKLYRRIYRGTSPIYFGRVGAVATSSNNTKAIDTTSRDRYVSPDFLRSRESIYRLVDIIDKLFDGIVEQR
jgi:hypothetical protein